MSEQNSNIGRRSLLKSGTAAAGALAGFPGISVAESEMTPQDLKKGKAPVVDVDIIHPNASDEVPRGHSDRYTLRTFVDEQGLFIVDDEVPSVKPGQGLVRTDTKQKWAKGKHHLTQGALLTSPKSSATEELSRDTLWSSDPYNPIELDVKMKGTRAVIMQSGEHVVTVEGGTTKQVELDERKLGVPIYGEEKEKEIERPNVEGTTTYREVVGTKQISVVPEVRVNNRGQLDVYGYEGKAVVPNPVPERLKHVVYNFSQSDRSQEKVKRTQGNEMVAIPKNTSDNTGGEE